jgi:hypothetical protein
MNENTLENPELSFSYGYGENRENSFKHSQLEMIENKLTVDKVNAETQSITLLKNP